MADSTRPVEESLGGFSLGSRSTHSRVSLIRFLPMLGIGLMMALGLDVLPASAQAPASAQTAEAALPEEAPVQMVQLLGPNQATPPATLTLHDALELAGKNDPVYLSAVVEAKIAHEDAVQAHGGILPTITATTQYLGTQGNGITPNGRYVTQDGVHVYRAWGVLHENISGSSLMITAYRRSMAAEAISKAKIEIARRGLAVTVTKNFYGLVVAQHKYATAQEALEQAKHFLAITQDSERAGQTAHSDVLKGQIQYELQAQAFDEAGLSLEEARLNLAVLLFPTLNENFSVVDDMGSALALPPFTEVQAMAERANPNLRIAAETVRQSDLDAFAAKAAFFPSLDIEADYGIEANAFALHSVSAAFPEKGPLPNLGYFVTANLSVPVWDWGGLRSKLHQAKYRQAQVRAELSQAQRELLNNLYSYYNEALVSRASVDRARRTADLAAESLRLINLRYQAGTSTALEVVDAATSLTQARNSYDDAEVRYRTAVTNLQTLTGSF